MLYMYVCIYVCICIYILTVHLAKKRHNLLAVGNATRDKLTHASCLLWAKRHISSPRGAERK